MIAHTYLPLDGMRPTGAIQYGAGVSTRLRGVGRSAYAIADIRVSRQSIDVRFVGREWKAVKQDRAERRGAGIGKRGRRQ